MRNLQFRIWSKKEKMFVAGLETFIGPGYTSLNEKDDDLIVTQYIGVQDRNKKEIYEGDIVEFYLDSEKKYPVLARIRWLDTVVSYSLCTTIDDSCSRYDLYLWASEYYRFGEGFPSDGLKIVGNIFQNPELLPSSEELQKNISRNQALTILKEESSWKKNNG